MQTYLSIADVPLDEYITLDVGDMHPLTKREHSALKIQKRTGSSQPSFVLPYTRSIQLGSQGRDVIGAKRAIWKCNGLPIPKKATPNFGTIAVKQLKTAQKKLHLTQDGVLGPTTLKALSAYFDRLAFFDYAGYPPGGTKQQQQRNAIVAYVIWGFNQRALIYYAQIRPMDHMRDLYHLPEQEDCSTFATKAYCYGKATDPNGLNYNGYGNTVTMRAHGRIVVVNTAKPGDLCHYDGPQHVGVYVGNMRVIALGSDPGPLLLNVDYRPLTYIRSYI